MGKSVEIHIVFANYCNDTFSLPENMLELATFKNQKGLGEKKIISYDKIKNEECFRFEKCFASFNQ